MQGLPRELTVNHLLKKIPAAIKPESTLCSCPWALSSANLIHFTSHAPFP